MPRRTPPLGVPFRASSEWDVPSNPGIDEYELAEVRRKRNEKISRSITLAELAARTAKDAHDTTAQLRADLAQLHKEVLELREKVLGLGHTLRQIDEALREAGKEAGAWKRQALQSALAACAVGIALASVLSTRC